MIRKVTLFVAVLSLLGMSASHAAADYRITDLGTLPGGRETYAYGLNEFGEVVGTVYERAVNLEANYAFVWQNGRLAALVSVPSARTYSAAYGINDSGQIVGTYAGSSVLWENGSTTRLGAGVALAINNSGQVVGASNLDYFDRSTHALFWQSGTLTDLGQGYAKAINASGQIVGSSNGNAVLWQNGTMTTLGPGSASGINASGQVVGFSNGEGMLWQNGTMIDLGPGHANAINDLGQVVGGSFLWQNGRMTDLSQLIPADSGWRITEAFAINDAGEIAGYGARHGLIRAFLLTPNQAPVPEPSTLLLLGIGSIGLLGWAWRRRRGSVAV